MIEAHIAHRRRRAQTRMHRPSAGEVVDRLAPVLLGTPRELLASLEHEIQWVALPRATVLMREGESADCMYLVVSGRLGAYARREDQTRLLLSEMGPGESVGEMALLGKGPRHRRCRGPRRLRAAASLTPGVRPPSPADRRLFRLGRRFGARRVAGGRPSVFAQPFVLCGCQRAVAMKHAAETGHLARRPTKRV